MDWLIFVIAAGIFSAASNLISRYLLKGNKDSWAFSFFYSGIGAIISLPFMIWNFKMATTVGPWLLMLLVGVLIVLNNYLNFKSLRFIEPSVQGSILKMRLVWAFILGIIFLAEPFSWNKLLGTVVIILAGIIIAWKKRDSQSIQGIILAFVSTIVYSTVLLFYKQLFKDFNTASLTFLIFFIPAVLNLLVMPNSFKRIKETFQINPRGIIVACALGGFTNLAFNQAVSLGQISVVPAIAEAFLLLVLVGEHFILKEKQHLQVKIIAVVLAVLGALLIIAIR
jgi:drug/metabolite transporter (DMT)-like permease